MKISRKNFLKFSLVGLALPKMLSSKEKDIKPLFLNEKTLVLNKEKKLESYSSIIGPGRIIVDSKCEFIRLGGKNTTIRDVEFLVKGRKGKHTTLFKLEESSENILIENCSFVGGRYTVLKADVNKDKDSELGFGQSCENIKILNCNFSGSFTHHLYLHSISNLKISGCTFEGSTRDSIRLRQRIDRVSIDNNTFENIGKKSKDSSDAIDSYWSGEELIISNNNISGCYTHGLDIKGVSPDKSSKTSKVIISNNIIQDCRYSGILISSGSTVKKGSFVSNFTVNSNQLLNNNLNKENVMDAAIFLRHGVKNAIISSNIIHSKYSHGIVAASFETNALQTENILINSNIVNTSSGLYSIHARAVKNLKIEGNILSGKKSIMKKYKRFES